MYIYRAQPYFNSFGNAISSFAFTICFVAFFISIFFDFSFGSFANYHNITFVLHEPNEPKLPAEIYQIIIVWVCFGVGGLSLAFLMGFLTFKKARSEWAMKLKGQIPVPKEKKKITSEKSEEVIDVTKTTAAVSLCVCVNLCVCESVHV
jgi:hypothetical protein